MCIRDRAKNPKLLLCDEPTGALDYNTGKAILRLLQDTCREKGMTVILITHNSAIAPMADRVIHIKNGKVSNIVENENPVSYTHLQNVAAVWDCGIHGDCCCGVCVLHAWNGMDCGTVCIAGTYRTSCVFCESVPYF